MLLPFLNKARERARARDCLNRMKQIMTGFHLYSDDNDNYMFTHVCWMEVIRRGAVMVDKKYLPENVLCSPVMERKAEYNKFYRTYGIYRVLLNTSTYYES